MVIFVRTILKCQISACPLSERSYLLEITRYLNCFPDLNTQLLASGFREKFRLRLMKIGKLWKYITGFSCPSLLICRLIRPWRWGLVGFQRWSRSKIRWENLMPVSAYFYNIPVHFETGENVADGPPFDTKTTHFCRQILKTIDFENGTLTGTFENVTFWTLEGVEMGTFFNVFKNAA